MAVLHAPPFGMFLQLSNAILKAAQRKGLHWTTDSKS